MKKNSFYILWLCAAVMLMATSCSKSSDDVIKPIEPQEQLKPGNYIDTVVVDGVKRAFAYYIPEDLPDSCSIIFEFHGSYMHHSMSDPTKINDPLQDAQFTPFYYLASQKKSFVYVFPRGEDLVSANSINWSNDINIPFFIKMREYFLSRYSKISKRKVYCCGHSSGAIFSLRLAVECPKYISAAVSVSGQLTTSRIHPLQGGPIPILQINGKIDRSVDYTTSLNNARKIAMFINGNTEENLEQAVGVGGYPVVDKQYIGDKYTWKGGQADYVFYGITKADHNVSWLRVENDMLKFMEDHPRK